MIGQLHPLLVHLPIGFTILAGIFKLLSYRKAYQFLKPTLSLILFFNGLFTVLALLTGYFLYQSGDYEAGLLQKHQYLAYFFGISSSVLWYLVKYQNKAWLEHTIWVITLASLMLVGHFGGTITHGELFSEKKTEEGVLPKTIDLEKALVYQDIIAPILAKKCYSCHSSSKQKGKLRLDTPALILKGGKNGKILLAHQTEQSELFARLILPKENEKHMPPDGKPQLEETEIKIIKWWIDAGADFNTSLKAMAVDSATYGLLKTYTQVATKQAVLLPAKEVKAIDKNTYQALVGLGYSVSPVAQQSPWLVVNFNGKTPTKQELKLLGQLKENIVWLTANKLVWSTEIGQFFSQLEVLTKLNIAQTNTTSLDLKVLSNLPELKVLNINQSKLGPQFLADFGAFKNLQKLYLNETNLTKSDSIKLKQTLPNTLIEFGAYTLPSLSTDTARLKPIPLQL